MGIETALLIGGTALSAAGSIRDGEAAKKNADYNAAIDDYNASYAGQKAKFDEARLRDDEARTKGSARAVMGSQGFAVDEGSNVNVIDDMARSFAIDASIIRTGGKAEAAGYKNSAAAQRYQGEQAQSAGYINAFSDMLIGGSNAAGSFKTTASPKNVLLTSSKYRWGRYA